MRVERFFEKFELLSDTPNAIDGFRKLVLGLAVRGRLVAQRAADGDGQSLLHAIRCARGTSGTAAALEGFNVPDAEQWHEVPASWRWVRLAALGRIVGGGTPRSDHSAYFSKAGIPWLTPADLNGYTEKRISSGRRFLTDLGLKESSAQLLPEGSVLFSSRAPIGYVAIAGQPLATNQGFKSCAPFVQDMNEYLYYFLRFAAERIDREAPATTFREVSGKAVGQIPVPLPPLAEQKRIVAKVDELMALCDRLEALQQERKTRHTALASASVERCSEEPTPANLDFLFHRSYDIEPRELRKVVLALAIRGKLEPQRRSDEPVDDLLGRVQRKRRALVAERRASDGCALPPVGVEEQAFGVPNTWRWIRFGAVSVCRDGQRIPVSKDERAGRRGPYDYYGASGVIDKIDGFLFDEPLLLIGEDGANLLNRSTPIAFLAYGKYWVNNHAHVLDSDSVDVLRYLALVFNAIDLAPFVTGTAQPKMNQAKMNSIPIPVPPVEEQRRIVEKVDRLMDLVDKLDESLVVSRAAGEKILEAVVAELTESARAA